MWESEILIYSPYCSAMRDANAIKLLTDVDELIKHIIIYPLAQNGYFTCFHWMNVYYQNSRIWDDTYEEEEFHLLPSKSLDWEWLLRFLECVILIVR